MQVEASDARLPLSPAGRDRLLKLSAQLNTNSLSARDTLATLREELLQQGQGASLEVLEQQLSHLDFEAAASLVDNWLSNRPNT